MTKRESTLLGQWPGLQSPKRMAVEGFRVVGGNYLDVADMLVIRGSLY